MSSLCRFYAVLLGYSIVLVCWETDNKQVNILYYLRS